MHQTHHWGRILCPGLCQAVEQTQNARVVGAMNEILLVTGKRRGLGVAAVALLLERCARDSLATWRVFVAEKIFGVGREDLLSSGLAAALLQRAGACEAGDWFGSYREAREGFARFVFLEDRQCLQCGVGEQRRYPGFF